MCAIRRPAVLIAVLTVLGTALAACGSGPSQANAAVIIGDRVISVDDVQRRLDTALNNEPAAKELAKNRKLDLVSRGIVSQLIRHELLAERAQREGLTVSDKDVTSLAGQAPPDDPVQRSVDAAFDSRELARDRLLAVELGRKYVDKVQLTLDGAAIGGPNVTRQAAMDLARQIAARPDQAAQIGQNAAGQDGQGQQLASFPWNAIRAYETAVQNAQSNQSNAPPPADVMVPSLFAVPANSVVAVPLGSGEQAESAGWLVAVVHRKEDGVPAQEASFASDVPADWLFALGEHLLGPFTDELNIKISPRYGVWDELAVGLAPNDAEKKGLVLSTATPQP